MKALPKQNHDTSVICDTSKLTDKGCNGAPDWIIEIVSPASKRMDYYTKLFKYRTDSYISMYELDGYNDYFYFTKVFKKNTGISPSKYRKNLLEH